MLLFTGCGGLDFDRTLSASFANQPLQPISDLASHPREHFLMPHHHRLAEFDIGNQLPLLSLQRHLDTANIEIPPTHRFLIDESHEALFVRLQLGRRELVRLVRDGRDFLDEEALGARHVSNYGTVRGTVEDGVEQTHFVHDELLFVDGDAIADVLGLLGEDELACCYELGDGAAQCKGESGDSCPDRRQVRCQVLDEDCGFSVVG